MEDTWSGAATSLSRQSVSLAPPTKFTRHCSTVACEKVHFDRGAPPACDRSRVARNKAAVELTCKDV